VTDLRIDFDRLERAETRLAAVIAEFDAATPAQDALAGAVGHGQVEIAVTDFRNAWSIRREEYAQELRTIQDAVVAIRETFEAVDVELGRRLDAITEETP
jgi:hypothetical protein